jgi:molecular chaperone DnaJ
MPDKDDFYEILGVGRDADPAQIKKAYRELAMNCHPDRNPGDAQAEELFKKATEAYGVLSDPEKRRLYDAYGREGLRGMNTRGPGFDDIFSGFGFGDIGDIFRDFFGGGQSREASRRGRDIAWETVLDFVESYTGCEKELRVLREDNCEACGGTGSRTRSLKTCPQCSGSGQIYQSHGFIRMASTCPKCGGKGQTAADPCQDCRGSGRVRREASVLVKIPAGVETGQRLRVPGKGDSGRSGAPAGDLFVEITVKPGDPFYRDKAHLHLDKSIDVVLAALGGELEVPTVTGESRVVEVQPGTQTGKTLRIPGLGFPNPVRPAAARGDYLVNLVVKTPVGLTERQEELLREFAAIEEEKGGESPLRLLKRKVGEKIKKVFK